MGAELRSVLNQMKTIGLSLGLWLMGLNGMAQFSLDVSIKIMDNGTPVANEWVYWETGESSRSFLTDTAGEYSFVDTLTESFGEGEAYLVNCANDTLLQKQSYIEGVHTNLHFDFQYCDTAGLSSLFSLEGNVNWSNDNMKDNAVQVWLMEHDSLSNQLSTFHSMYSVSGFYQFGSLGSGTYLLRAAMVEGSNLVQDYLPTYLGGGLFWQDALSSIISQSDVENPALNLVPRQAPGGKRQISGYVFAGETTDPVENVSVLVLNSLGEPVGYDFSGPNGHYSISDLTLGDYQLYAEVPGKMAYPVQLNLTTQSLNEVNFRIDPFSTEGMTMATSVQDEMRISVRAFPNPTAGKLILELNFNPENHDRVQVFNLEGRKVADFKLKDFVANNHIEIDLSALSGGLYLLQFQTDRGVWQEKIYLK
jgi:hypothetical protein